MHAATFNARVFYFRKYTDIAFSIVLLLFIWLGWTTNFFLFPFYTNFGAVTLWRH
jgi:hypothetical protein